MYEIYVVDEMGRGRTFFVANSNYDLARTEAHEHMMFEDEEIGYMRRVM